MFAPWRGETLADTYQIGDVVDGRYRILEQLGSGGMGGVYLAEQLNLGRQIALKVLHHDAASDPIARERFVREARAVCHLKHPNLVVYYDFGTESETGRLYLAMEHLQGRSLASLTSQTTPIPIDRVTHIIDQLCGALAVAHRGGVIHRDMKPGNVMLVRRENDKDFVKLIDFGISRVLKGSETPGQSEMDLTQTGVLIGTTAYLAPEYIRNQVVDERVDIYALGIITYELIAGRRPFEAADQIQMLMKHIHDAPIPFDQLADGRNVPANVSSVVLKALEKEPEQRYGTVDTFRADFRSAVASLLDEAAIGATMQHRIPEFLIGAADTAAEIAAVPSLALRDTGPSPVSTEPTLSTVALDRKPVSSSTKGGLYRLFALGLLSALLVGLCVVGWMYGTSSSTVLSGEPPSVTLPPLISLADMPTRDRLHIESNAGASLPGRRPAQPEVRRDGPKPPPVELVAGSSSMANTTPSDIPKESPIPAHILQKKKLAAALARAKKAKVAGNWQATIRAYRDAYKIKSSLSYLKHIGQAQIKLGNRAGACRTFQRFIKRVASAKRPDAMERLAVYGCNLSL
jgi:serine/threonine protein kinase